jgi:hypothetical protein
VHIHVYKTSNCSELSFVNNAGDSYILRPQIINTDVRPEQSRLTAHHAQSVLS